MASGLAVLGRPTKALADEPREPIVGGWEMTLSLGGTITDYIFEQFHSDGTEIENDITDVLSGNVCMGVWEKLYDGTYGVTHPSFNFFGYDIHPGVCYSRTQQLPLRRASRANLTALLPCCFSD
jgi:hypothetical protein